MIVSYLVTEDSLGSRYRMTVSQQTSGQSHGSFPSTINVVSTLRFTGEGRGRGSANQVGPDDAGEYRCRFENSVGTAESAVLLRVEHAPLMVTSASGSLSTFYTLSGSTIRGGATSMAASRLRPGTSLSSPTSGVSVAAYSGGALSHHAPGDNDGQTTSLTTGSGHRYWGKVAADPGDTAELVCRMKAYPAPVFSWERVVISSDAAADGATQPIRNSARYSVTPTTQLLIQRPAIDQHEFSDSDDNSKKDTTPTTIESSVFESVLKVYNVKEDVYGEFVCVANNAMGSAKTKMALVRKGRPDSPADLRAHSTEANRVLVTWLEGFDGGFNATRVSLQYRELGTSLESAKVMFYL